MNIRPFASLVVGAALSSTACLVDTSPRDSHESPTDQINASISVVDNGTDVDIFVRLTRGLTDLRVTGGEQLSATVGSQSVDLHERVDGDAVHYLGKGASVSSATPFTVTLNRIAPTAAVTSEATIPAPITVRGLPEVIHEGDELEVTLDRELETDELAYLKLLGECLKDSEEANRVALHASYQDRKKLTAEVSGLDYSNARTCAISAHVQVRNRAGKIDPALHWFSHIEGVQDRVFEIRLETK